MKFGVSLLGLAQQPRGADMVRGLDELITFVHAIRDAGFDYLMTGQHFLLDPLCELQPAPLLARLAPESGRMGLFTTLIAPLQNPVELAETWASIDVITGGRVGLCFALGYRDVEYAAFGVDPGKRVTELRAVVDTLRALWTQEEVTASGPRFTLDRATCTLRPLQQPHPPIWIAANADAAVVRAGRWGLPWNINSHARFETIERQVGLYRDAAKAAGHPEPTFPISRDVFVAETTEEAFALARPYLGLKFDAYAQWGQHKALPGNEEFDIPFDDLAQDRFILGDADEVARQIERYAALGVDRMHLRMNWPGMPLDLALDGLRRFAADVRPRFASAVR